MSYWRSETLRDRIKAEGLIVPFDEEHIKHCAYELTMGSEAFITSTDGKKKIVLDDGEPVVVPPGQFALLITEAEVKIPLDAIGFISMRFSIKRRGLVNVSGFHVDPGFKGRLKFSVFNAGSKDITVSRGDRVFLLWYAKLDGETKDGYGEAGPDQNTITSSDQNVMHGEVASPGELKKEIAEVRHFYGNAKWTLTVLVGVCIAILVRLCFTSYFAVPTPNDMETIKADLKKDIQQELLIELKGSTAEADLTTPKATTTRPAGDSGSDSTTDASKTSSD